MNKKSGTRKASATKPVKTIRRKTRQTYASEEKIGIVLAGLRGEETFSVLCPPLSAVVLIGHSGQRRFNCWQRLALLRKMRCQAVFSSSTMTRCPRNC